MRAIFIKYSFSLNFNFHFYHRNTFIYFIKDIFQKIQNIDVFITQPNQVLNFSIKRQLQYYRKLKQDLKIKRNQKEDLPLSNISLSNLSECSSYNILTLISQQFISSNFHFLKFQNLKLKNWSVIYLKHYTHARIHVHTYKRTRAEKNTCSYAMQKFSRVLL